MVDCSASSQLLCGFNFYLQFKIKEFFSLFFFKTSLQSVDKKAFHLNRLYALA